MAGAATAVVSAAVAATVLTVAPAYADCGDPGQSPCAGTVPTADQVVAILAEMTDPSIPAASKTDIVTPGFAPDEAGTIDNHLDRVEAFGGLLPPNFVVTDIGHPPTLPAPPWPPQGDISTPPGPGPSC